MVKVIPIKTIRKILLNAEQLKAKKGLGWERYKKGIINYAEKLKNAK